MNQKLISRVSARIRYSGLSLLMLATGTAQADPITEITGLSQFQYIGIVGLLIALIIVVVIWKFIQHGDSGSSVPFKGLESSALDSNPELRMQFYTMAFEYREEHGHIKYHKSIVNHFKFMYGFHNRALQLIDDLFTKTSGFIPSCEFVLATIKSGHIGQLFTDINYEGGIKDVNAGSRTPMIAYANTDSIDFWISHATQPLCSLNKKQFDLRRANKTDGYVTATLLAEIKNTYKNIKIKLGFPDYHYDINKEEIYQHDIIATQNYHKFEDWLKQCAPKRASGDQSNFGISVEHNYDVDYGIPAPELVTSDTVQPNFLSQALYMLKQTKVDAFFTRYDMAIVKQKSAMDALVLCSGLGLVVISEQHTTGSVSYNGDAGWLVVENKRSQIVENACIQTDRAKKSLLKYLGLNDLKNWPIFSLVVFSANDVELNLKPGSTHPQCDVIRLNDLAQWFDSNSTSNNTRFTKEDHNNLSLLLNGKQGEYKSRLKEA